MTFGSKLTILSAFHSEELLVTATETYSGYEFVFLTHRDLARTSREVLRMLPSLQTWDTT